MSKKNPSAQKLTTQCRPTTTLPHFISDTSRSDTSFGFRTSGRWRDKRSLRDLFTRGLTGDYLTNFTNFGGTKLASRRLNQNLRHCANRYAAFLGRQNKMIILPTRERFIQDNFFELSFQDRRPDFRIFQSLSSTEQYYLADIYNWDDGTEILNWIIDSEKCDKGTAALIFWRAEPDFYINRTSQTIANYERDVFDLLKKIVSKFNSDSFKRGRLKFDPETKVDEIDWDKVYDEWGKIPTALKYPTKGIVPISLSRIARFIAQWQQRRKYKKREAKRQKRKQKTPHNSG